jgi:hypothetical protein
MSNVKNIELLKEALTLPFLKTKHLQALFCCGMTKASDISQKIKNDIIADEKEIWCNMLPKDYVEKKLIEYTNTTFEQLKQDLERMGYISKLEKKGC